MTRIPASVYPGIGAALMLAAGAISSAQNVGHPLDLPTGEPPAAPAAQKPSPPSRFLVSLAEAIEKNDNKTEPGIRLITKRHIEFIQKEPDSLFAYEVLKSPIIPVTDALEKFSREKNNTMASMAIAMRLPKERITKEDIENSRKEESVKFYFGLNQNPNRPFEKEDFELAKRNNQYFPIILRTQMNDEIRKYILDNINESSWAVYYGVQNPLLIDSEKTQSILRDVVIKSPFTWAADGIPSNPRFIFTNEVIESSLKNKDTPGGNAIFRSEYARKNPTLVAIGNSDSRLKSALTGATYYDELFQYHNSGYFITNSDIEAAKEFYTDTIAKIIMSSPRVRPTEEQINFALQDTEHANSAYAIGIFSNPNTEINLKHLEWIVSSQEKANTQAAYEITRRLTQEQFYTQIKDTTSRNLIRGMFCDTLAAKGAGENYFFAPINSRLGGYYLYGDRERELFRGVMRFSQLNYAAVSSSAFIPDEADKKEAKSEFAPPAASFNMGRNLSWGNITDAEYDFMVNNSDHSLSLGLAGNHNLNRNNKLETLVQKLTKASPGSQILFELANNQNWLRDLNEKQKENELKFALENLNSQYANGYFRNILTIIPDNTKKILRKNPDSPGAIGAGKNIFGYKMEKDDIDFVLGEGKKTVLGLVLATRADFPADRLLQAARDSNDLRSYILYHPAFRMTLPYTGNR